MAHYLTNNEKFHIFSKSPVLSSMAVSQAVNKSGHTVSTNDVWADDVPWFTEVADEAGAITRAADARYNDLILWGSDIYVRKGDKTNGASTGTTFVELWEKHTDLTEARNYALGSVTTQTPTNIVTKTVELKNASDKVVLKYHVGKQIDLLTTDNNANVASTWAARMFIDGKVVDQFVSPTDKVFAGNPSTGYTTLVYTATAAGNNYGFVSEGEADEDFVNNAFAGIVQFNTSRDDTHKFAASVFEYVGDKLDSTVAKLSAAVFGSGGDSDQPTDLVTQVNLNTAAITTLNGDVNTNGSIAQKIDTAINGLGDVAVKSDITITDIKVKQGSGEAESLTITDKSVTIEIPEVPAADVTEEGAVTTDGFTKTSDVTNLAKAAIKDAITTDNGAIKDAIDSAISDATLADGQKIATTADTTKLVTVEDVTTYVSENAKVTLTQGTGITVTPNGEASTAFTIAVDDTVATTQSVTDLTGRVTTAEGEIDALQTAVESLTTGDNSVASQIANTTLSATSTGSDNVTVTLGGTVSVPTLTVTGTDIASAQALAALEQTVTEHITNAGGKLEISVPEGGTLPTTGEAGKIYLIPNNGEEEQNIYDEFVWTNGKWEKIGSTKVDLTDYVTNSSLTTTLEGYLTTADKTTLEGQITAAQTAAQTAQTTAESKVAQSDYDTKVAQLEEAIQNAAPANYITSINGSTGAKAITIKDGRETVYPNDLWGTSVTTDGATITVDHKYLSNPNSEEAWLENVKAVQDNKAYSEITTDADGKFTEVVVDSVVANIQTEMIKDGSYMFYATSIASFSGDLSSLVDGTRMFQQTSLTSFTSDSLSSLVDGEAMFRGSLLASFSGDLSNLVNGRSMFQQTSLNSFTSDSLSSLVDGAGMFRSTSLTQFSGDLSSLVDGTWMFNDCTNLTSFTSDLSNLVNGQQMFVNAALESFSGDLSSLLNGHNMFSSYGQARLESFNGDLSSLLDGTRMFYNTKLDTESVECIADTIRNVTDLSENTIKGSDGRLYNVTKQIDIYIANISPNEAENAAFWTMVNEKGWDVLVNGSSYNPTEPTAIATVDENGEEVTTPIPFWAKPVETDEEHAEYVGEDGKFYNVVGGQFIYVSDPETYGQFTSLADAVANMRLTKIEKKA